jgi:predicted membrane channel-forming protein YqfA (hemolysin III family)
MTQPDPWRPAARIANVVGAAGSLIPMFMVGRDAPAFLIVLFTGWVLSPFIAFWIADSKSNRWARASRTTLHLAMVILAVGSLALYADVVVRPRPQPAAMFLLVPLGSWMLTAIAVSIAAFVSRR